MAIEAKLHMHFYRRHLPHWQPEGKPLFVTWRLWGSLPRSIRLRLQDAQAKKECGDTKKRGFFISSDPGARVVKSRRMAAREFVRIDRLLDAAGTGPLWLKDHRIATQVVDTLHYATNTLGLCEVHAYVVMANHVHLLLSPKSPLARITRAIKGYSARRANDILGRTHAPFWQDESYDHWVRSEASFAKIVDYIENNPVSAGLATGPIEWPWSSASRPL